MILDDWFGPTDNFRPVFNGWTFMHIMTGFLIGWFKIKFRHAVIIIVGWELLEQFILVPLKFAWPPELILDSLLDIVMGLFGYCLAYAFSPIKPRK